MTFRKLNPDFLLQGGGYKTGKVVVIDDEGRILTIDDSDQHDSASQQKLSGALVPGFVNTHCHLELSHMKGAIESGTGLVKFIEGIVSQREADPSRINDAIIGADREMSSNGIVAVGDICNRVDTIDTKETSEIFYYSFVEMFDFMQPALASEKFRDYRRVFDQIAVSAGHKKSMVPHAPYSVSSDLFQMIRSSNNSEGSVSIHNQETASEDEMFFHKTGDLIELFQNFGFSFSHFLAYGNNSIYYSLQQLDPECNNLFVHNTFTTEQNILDTEKWSDKCFWVSCPNANIYIEDRLPDYDIFIRNGVKMCLGTDSLASNWQLCILEEIKTIRKHFPHIPDEQLLSWATTNGAQALGQGHVFGTIEVNKKPGLNLISLNSENRIDFSSKLFKIG